MDVAAMAGFVSLVAAMVLVPGPDFMFMLTSGMRYRLVRPPVIGLATGHLILVAGLALGVGPLVSSVPAVLTVLTLVGAAYLMYLGIDVLRTAKSSGVQASDLVGEVRRGQLFKRGLGIATLNPKAILFYLAIVPQFANSSASWPLPVQFAVLGGIFIVGCLIVYIPLGLLSGKVIAAHPRISEVITYIAGIIMIVLSIGLLIDQVG